MAEALLGTSLSGTAAAGRCHFLGHREDALAIVGACDATVLPAIKREGLPKTVIESMALGVVPIVTRTGGSPELLVDGESGLVVPPGDAAALATVSRSSAQSIFQAEMVALDGLPASLKVGDRYPIITSAYVGPGGTSQDSGIAPAVQFQDLGLVLKVTPTVHGNGEMTLDVDAEQNALGGTASNGNVKLTSPRSLPQTMY